LNLIKNMESNTELNCPMADGNKTLAITLMALALAAGAMPATGQAKKKTEEKPAPTLRAISVYEWTGPMDKPTASRIVPVAVYDGEQLQDGTVYLSRPEPMAIAPQVEYEVQQSGHPVQLFAVQNAARIEGNWVGVGAPLPLPVEKKQRQKQIQKIDDFGESDRPVLHRKHAAKSTDDKSKSGGDEGQPSAAQADDPDRPKLHRKTDAGSGDATTPGTQPTATDSDRPVLHHAEPKPDTSKVSDEEIDPNRPRLRRGMMGEQKLELTPGLKGLPADMDQAVAVSDAANRTEHLWKYHWADAGEEEKLKSALEAIAREAMGMTPPPVVKKPVKPGVKTARTKPSTVPAEPPALGDENFKCYELTYNSNATLVLTATNDLTGKDAKYITLIAQPDLYGNPLVVLKQVTDLSHLDERPRMRLIDAVDAMADHRGELLFELRTTEERQFALYRMARGTAEKIFTTGTPQN
jgi:hypothetical protein